ncbi:hypothetical protein ACRALDRAFT_2034792 [Sodiomyces alcalophilus JCM 7366]|uniref:uncharacterized protein n=1 Tax=Sodiomyces alcalophilus JCM 7366 TaxID=591952 RepID=UPI0039B4E836
MVHRLDSRLAHVGVSFYPSTAPGVPSLAASRHGNTVAPTILTIAIFSRQCRRVGATSLFPVFPRCSFREAGRLTYVLFGEGFAKRGNRRMFGLFVQSHHVKLGPLGSDPDMHLESDWH